MKLFNLTFIFAIGALMFGQAQNQATEKAVTMSLGSQNAFVLDLTEINADEALNYWKAYMKDYKRIKRNRKANEWYAESVSIPTLSSNKINVYSKIEDLTENSRIMVWFDDNSSFIASSANHANAEKALKFINDFAVVAEKTHVEGLIKTGKKSLGNFEGELKSMAKNQTRLEKDIVDYERKIEDAKKRIEELKIEQENQKTKIDAQKTLVDKLIERLSNVGKKHAKM